MNSKAGIAAGLESPFVSNASCLQTLCSATDPFNSLSRPVAT